MPHTRITALTTTHPDIKPTTYRDLAVWALLLCLVLATLTSAPSVHAEITTMGDAINIAGRQRMLSQRIAESYLLKAMQPDSERGPTLLNRCVNEFDRNLEDLSRFAPAASLNTDLDAVKAAWEPYKQLVNAPIDKSQGVMLIRQSNQVLAAAHAYVNKLQTLSGTTTAELINIAGRQRMLSQRIAKNFLAARWGIDTQITTEALYEDLAEYQNMLDYLLASDVNTPAITAQLNKVKGYFNYASKGFDGAMDLSEDRLIHVVTGTTDYMLRGMDITTGLYAQLLD